jgi:hypothetical protein
MENILDIITEEVHKYLFESVEVGDGIKFSEYKLKKRINYFRHNYYPTGKVTEDGDVDYWFDLIQPRVSTGVKNMRMDSKYFLVFSKNPIKDFPAVYIANTKLADWMEETHRSEEFNESTSEYYGTGNVLFRKIDRGYEVSDFLNTFLTNTTAKTVNETAVIERFYLTQSELRAKDGLYKNVEEVIEHCGNKFFSKTELGTEESKTAPIYELYRRTGEVSEEVLFKAQGKKGGKKEKFLLARFIVVGVKKGKTGERYVLFAEPLEGKMSDYFVEAHAGDYKGRWWREGLYELLFDYQTRYNDITNEMSRGLSWASKTLFRHTDIRTLQNIRTALSNGALIKSADIQQIEVRMQGFDQLANERNTIIALADHVANSFEVVTGEPQPRKTTLGEVEIQDINATKFFEHLRKKLAIAYRRVYREYVLREFVKDISGQDIIRLTGNPQILDAFREMVAESWFWKNIALIGPHTPEMRQQLIALKTQELSQLDPTIQNTKEIWKGVLPRLFVTIVGENFNLDEQKTVMQMLQFEQDPGRRAWLTDYIYRAKGIPVPPPIQPQVVDGQGDGTEVPEEELELSTT